jgi:hypothetical protein
MSAATIGSATRRGYFFFPSRLCPAQGAADGIYHDTTGDRSVLSAQPKTVIGPSLVTDSAAWAAPACAAIIYSIPTTLPTFPEDCQHATAHLHSRSTRLDELREVGKDFDVIVPTGADEGPRARK